MDDLYSQKDDEFLRIQALEYSLKNLNSEYTADTEFVLQRTAAFENYIRTGKVEVDSQESVE